MEEAHTYSTGDWIVHSHFGVGQIKGIEEKNISGSESSYFRVTTSESTFWLPVDQINTDLIRPLSTTEEIEEVISTLQKPAEEMSPHTKIRQNRIHTVRLGNTPSDIAELIRDLRARQRDKGILYSSERSAFRTLKQQLAQEWAIVTGTEAATIDLEIDSLLDKHRLTKSGKGQPSSS